MASKLEQSVIRFEQNEDRINIWVNGTELDFYISTEGVKTPTIAAFMKNLNERVTQQLRTSETNVNTFLTQSKKSLDDQLSDNNTKVNKFIADSTARVDKVVNDGNTAINQVVNNGNQKIDNLVQESEEHIAEIKRLIQQAIDEGAQNDSLIVTFSGRTQRLKNQDVYALHDINTNISTAILNVTDKVLIPRGNHAATIPVGELQNTSSALLNLVMHGNLTLNLADGEHALAAPLLIKSSGRGTLTLKGATPTASGTASKADIVAVSGNTSQIKITIMGTASSAWVGKYLLLKPSVFPNTGEHSGIVGAHKVLSVSGSVVTCELIQNIKNEASKSFTLTGYTYTMLRSVISANRVSAIVAQGCEVTLENLAIVGNAPTNLTPGDPQNVNIYGNMSFGASAINGGTVNLANNTAFVRFGGAAILASGSGSIITGENLFACNSGLHGVVCDTEGIAQLTNVYAGNCRGYGAVAVTQGQLICASMSSVNNTGSLVANTAATINVKDTLIVAYPTFSVVATFTNSSVTVTNIFGWLEGSIYSLGADSYMLQASSASSIEILTGDISFADDKLFFATTEASVIVRAGTYSTTSRYGTGYMVCALQGAKIFLHENITYDFSQSSDEPLNSFYKCRANGKVFVNGRAVYSGVESCTMLHGSTTQYKYGASEPVDVSAINLRPLEIVFGKDTFTENHSREFLQNQWYKMSNTAFASAKDNSRTNGEPQMRWSTIYAATGSINTSDEREKQQQRLLNELEKLAALDIKQSIGMFKFNDAVELKEDGARWHCGVMAQQVITIMQSHGLDPMQYAFICYDEWPAVTQPVFEEVSYTTEDGRSGTYLKDTGVTEIITPAGNRYGVRYEELAMFMLSIL